MYVKDSPTERSDDFSAEIVQALREGHMFQTMEGNMKATTKNALVNMVVIQNGRGDHFPDKIVNSIIITMNDVKGVLGFLRGLLRKLYKLLPTMQDTCK